jgi:aryl-alcohol dehydrogenase-like predicted oxidoreductase
MSLRPLGRSSLLVSPLCFGGNVFGWTADEKTSFSLLDAWLDAGFNFVDTADVYSRWAPGHVGGESETVIGKWLQQSGKRNKVVLATKVGMDMGDGKVGLKPAYIRQAVEDSLRRLQTDHIDLYQAHKDDEDTPLEDTLEAFAKLIQEGKVRVIGASNYSALACSRRWRRASAWASRATRRCSRSTTCTTAPRSRANCSRCACARAWASSTSTRWPPAS